MLDIISTAIEEFISGFMQQTSQLIRAEVDYFASTIKGSIENGIKEGFDSIRNLIFYLFLAVGATLLGMVFLVWGAAKVFGEMLGSEGSGFLVFGAVLVLIGLVSFSMSKPR